MILSVWNTVAETVGFKHPQQAMPATFKYQGFECFWNNDIQGMSKVLSNAKFGSALSLSRAIIGLSAPAQNLDMMILHNHFSQNYHTPALSHYRDWSGANKARLLETMEACLKTNRDDYIKRFNELLYDDKSFLYKVLVTPRFSLSTEAIYNTHAPTMGQARSLVIDYQAKPRERKAMDASA